MKKQKYLLLIICLLCALSFGACAKNSSDDDRDDKKTEHSEDDDDEDDDKKNSEDDKTDDETNVSDTDEASDKQDVNDEAARLTSYDWQGTDDGSLLVFEQDGTFRYYQSADNLTDYYFEGTYEFHVGADAVEYITTDLSQYSVTEDKLALVFDSNEQYDESNFVCFTLNNEACYMDGENAIDIPYQTPYFGFCLEEDGELYLDIANMNSYNYHLYVAK